MEHKELEQMIFQAISDPTRRQILILLAKEDLPITSITKAFPISRTAVNKHLHVLLEAGLVRKNKVGRESRYSLEAAPLKNVNQWLTFFNKYWDQQLLALKTFVEET